MKYRLLFLIGLMLCILTGCSKITINSGSQVDYYANDSGDANYKYEIEKVVNNSVFSEIIQGETVPVEVIYGVGGEGGYIQYSTKDWEIINSYIEAFRELKVKEAISQKNEMVIIIDGIEDYIFVMEDGTEIVIGTDLSTYISDTDVQYVLENNQKLSELNKLIQGD